GLLYTVILHVLWFFGFHGSNMLEPIALSRFQFTGDGQVFSKAFFDVFVVMGGCGTTICVLLVLLIFYRKYRLGNLAKVSSVTVIFNINEMLNFGIPIILNPVLFIPFILTPIVSFSISYAAVEMGLVPAMVQEVTWTTPVLFSGYVATGSINGTILQLVCIVTGMLIYMPFLRIHKDMEEMYAKEQIKLLINQLKESEERCETPNFLNRTDKIGLICKVLLSDLKNSLEKDELYLLYQPQIDSDGRCLGAEALLRWEHPTYGFIYPPLIIYLAKEGNILPELEKKIFDMAAKAIKQTSEQYDGEFKISVNITAKSLLWDIEEYIRKSVEKYNISHEQMWIEITEQDVISNADFIIDKLNKLKEMGHTLLIDDFGMGHTSLLYLQYNYFKIVKLDGSLVRNILTNKTNQKIIASIVELGSELNIKVIAEYVENEQQRQMLSELGCKWYQGYLFGRPVPLDDFIEELKIRNTKTVQ
ncbi:MAG: EAL domain-containing protein, partial [Butyrivibrio sp.]